MCTLVRIPVTLTGTGTGEVAKAFIIMLMTLAPAITDVCHVQTDSGATTAVETSTGVRITLVLVLVVRAVKHTIAAYIQGQAIARTWQ